MAAKRDSEDQTYDIEFDLIRGMKSKPLNSSAGPKFSNFVVPASDEKHCAVDDEHHICASMLASKVVQLATERWLFCAKCGCARHQWSTVTVTGRHKKLNDIDT